MYNYIYQQRIPMHDERRSVAIGAEHMEALKVKNKGMNGFNRAELIALKNARMKTELKQQKRITVYNI